VKIIISGGFGVGKTTAVAAISEIPVLNTEAAMTEVAAQIDRTGLTPEKTLTTVALDFGRLTIEEEIMLYLFGTPGQDRFGFMWHDLTQGALGALVIADTRRLGDCYSAVDYFEPVRLPFVVAVNRFDGRLAHDIADVRWALAVGDGLPVITFDARGRRSVRDALIAVLRRALAYPPSAGLPSPGAPLSGLARTGQRSAVSLEQGSRYGGHRGDIAPDALQLAQQPGVGADQQKGLVRSGEHGARPLERMGQHGRRRHRRGDEVDDHDVGSLSQRDQVLDQAVNGAAGQFPCRPQHRGEPEVVLNGRKCWGVCGGLAPAPNGRMCWGVCGGLAPAPNGRMCWGVCGGLAPARCVFYQHVRAPSGLSGGGGALPRCPEHDWCA
jgi:signal recognition particle receptor subunit beta